ncbi:MAG: hypothetical protein IPP83_14790 [Flavobacteriales bacterium]|nr:hypothetical protein [Flavobacteriales bacterium]
MRAVVFLPVLVVFGFSACRKDKECPEPDPAPVDGRDRFIGTYTVYDTSSNYLYTMLVSSFGSGGRDSLLLSNFADTFDLRILHERYYDTNFLGIGTSSVRGNSSRLVEIG